MRYIRSWTAMAIAALLTGALVLAACGDDDDANGGQTPDADGGTSTATIEPNGDDGENGNGGGDESPTPDAPTPTEPPAAETPDPGADPGGPIDGTVEPGDEGSTSMQELPPLPEPAEGIAELAKVRTGVHPEEGGWDRVVFEFAGAQAPATTIGYVPRALACGSGEAVELPGDAVLVVRFQGAVAHDDAGNVTVDVTEFEGHGDTVLAGEQTCDFEGQVAWHMGVAGEQNFKVTRLSQPTRLVVDVMHPDDASAE
ncbi:MAG: hypothetical protein U5Q44_12040 [Dehalococcoidia bacterium]|nr:hypothetical protein [Dehalococcoidia bacterium]